MRDRTFLILLPVFLLMLFCEIAFVCLTGTVIIINKLDNKSTKHPCQHEKKNADPSFRSEKTEKTMSTSPFFSAKLLSGLSLWMGFFPSGSAGDVNSVIVKAGAVPHHHCAYFIATPTTHLDYF